MNRNDIEIYRTRFAALEKVATKLDDYIHHCLMGVKNIDRISARAKTPDSFIKKANKQKDDGKPKYSSPLLQIQDQIGARIVVFLKNDVEIVATEMERYFQFVERQDHVPDSYWKFGYFGRHWIFALPDDVIPRDVEKEIVPRFFELQVKTLFQHAWSEANHDLCYKASGELTPEQQRLFAYTAAQAWGADRVFDELRSALFTKDFGNQILAK
jgi:putative GTP pyrophosphokinase